MPISREGAADVVVIDFLSFFVYDKMQHYNDNKLDTKLLNLNEYLFKMYVFAVTSCFRWNFYYLMK